MSYASITKVRDLQHFDFLVAQIVSNCNLLASGCHTKQQKINYAIRFSKIKIMLKEVKNFEEIVKFNL